MPRKNRIIKHNRLQVDKFTCNKRHYNSSDEAQAAAELQMLQKMNLQLGIYKCDLCNYWHLTRDISKQ